MSIVFPSEQEKRTLPAQILGELNVILDESKPLPLRAALLIKWIHFMNAYKPGTSDQIEPPKPEEMTPEVIREKAIELTKKVAHVFFSS